MKLYVTELGKNQFEVICNGEAIFQSYRSIIAIKRNCGQVSLSHHYDYSKTTMKYLKAFLGHGVAETRKKIDAGEYKVNIDIYGNDLKN